MEYAVVRGWRAYYLRVCHNRLETLGSPLWCLGGMGGMHVHENPAPRAKHKTGAYRPDWVKQGLEEHEFGPLFGCSCGYYALNEPDLNGATGLNVPYILIVWADITALGDTVIHDGGFRCESYKIERLFWPCMDSGLTTTYPSDYKTRDQLGGGYPYFYYAQPELLPLEDILPGIAADLGVELIRRPVGLWLQERNGIDTLIRSASAALGGES